MNHDIEQWRDFWQDADFPSRLDEGLGHGDVVGVAGAKQQHPRPALIIDQAMDFGRPAPSGAAYALEEGPPLAPAAER